ncbi:MAG TPA: hypothetical protein VMM57_03675 [Bacteroidota bacterium]|nr:hypothetical protein [Bacteroidota bacterium]
MPSLRILLDVTIYSSLLPVIVAFLRLRSLNRDLKTFTGLITVYSISVFLQLYLGRASINNLWVAHFYNLIEFNTLAILFSDWVDGDWSKAVMRLSIVLFSFFWLLSKVFLERIDEPSVYTSTIAKLVLGLMSIYLLLGFAKETESLIIEDPRFWITASVLIASAGSITFFALRGVIAKLPPEQLYRAYAIHWMILLITHCVNTWVFFCRDSVSQRSEFEATPRLITH